MQIVLAFSAVVSSWLRYFAHVFARLDQSEVTERLTRSIGLCIAMVVAIGLFKVILQC